MKKTIMIIMGLIMIMSLNVTAYDNYCRVFNGGSQFCYNGSGITSGAVSWSLLTDFPSACAAGEYVSAVGGSLVCSTPAGGSMAGYFNDIGNFTGTLTDTKYCTYDSINNEIDCNSEGGQAGIWENVTGVATYDGNVNISQNLTVGESILIGGDLLTVSSNNITPSANNTYYLGTSEKEWKQGNLVELCLNGDCQTTWPAGTGNVETGTAAGQMVFWDGSTEYKHTETSEIYWDDTNKRLGIGTATPGDALVVEGVDPKFRLYDSGSSATASYGIGTAGAYTSLISNAGDTNMMIRSYNSSNVQGYFLAGYMGFGISTPTSQVHVAGNTPRLTIGDAGAEDSSILFDGNVQDYYIALDDSADDLIIGSGSTIGSNLIVEISDDGRIFFNGAYQAGSYNNVRIKSDSAAVPLALEAGTAGYWTGFDLYDLGGTNKIGYLAAKTDRFLIGTLEAGAFTSITSGDGIEALNLESDQDGVFSQELQVSSTLVIGTGTGQVNITMTSPDNTEWCCGVDNTGTFACMTGACI